MIVSTFSVLTHKKIQARVKLEQSISWVDGDVRFISPKISL